VIYNAHGVLRLRMVFWPSAMRCVVLVMIVHIDGHIVDVPIVLCDVTSPYQRHIGDDDSKFSKIISYLFVFVYVFIIFVVLVAYRNVYRLG
jgi:hypothetical protein